MASPQLGPARLRLLPHPGRPYVALRDDLVRLGWEWANESQEKPMVPGEPEWVAYRHPAGAKLDYEYLPPVSLRTLVATGSPDALAPLGGLPQLRAGDLAALIDAPDTETVVRGLLGVQALVWLPLLGKVRELASTHPDPLVRQVAQDVATQLPVLAVADFDRWKAYREAHPGRSALLAMMPAADRRQVLRWMGADLRDAGPGVLEALSTGLEDDDPEVRATAAVTAARLAAYGVTDAVAGLDVPDVLEHPVVLARDALRSGRRLSIDEPRDAGTLLLYSLAEPVLDVPPPEALPAHLSGESGVRLRTSGLHVALVASVPHWLWSHGDGVRQVRPEAFLVTSAPVDAGTARAIGIRAPGADADPVLVTQEGAIGLAARVAALEGVPVDLVSGQRWEAALRGPDGRRFTAGNVEPDVAVSPWGALAVPGVRERLAGGLAADPADLGTVEAASPDEPLPVRLAMRFPL
jgi:hypothetical protein